MRRHSDLFPFVLTAATVALFAIFKSIYEDAAKAWVLVKLAERGYGAEAASVMSGFVEITPALGLSLLIVWLLHRYIQHQFEKRNIELVRELEVPEGDFGHYTAYVRVRNTSRTEKLGNCRCEILELRDSDGFLIQRNIGLRTRGQENKEDQGRFNLDQDSIKDIPLFEIDQSRDEGLSIVNANKWDLSLEHGTYTVRIMSYGDSGIPDEMTVKINSRNCEFIILDKVTATKLSNEQSKSRSVTIDEPPDFLLMRVRLSELRSTGVTLRNAGTALQNSNGDFEAWETSINAWLQQVVSEISAIDAADSEWFKVLDAVPDPRVPLYFPKKHKEGKHIKLHREHDYRLLRLDKLLEKYGGIK